MPHTIVLLQANKKLESRTYSDYEDLNDALEGICKIYEEHLKRQNPNTPQITYDISNLFDFLDELADLSCLVYTPNLLFSQQSCAAYMPRNKDWIKEKIYVMLMKAVGGS